MNRHPFLSVVVVAQMEAVHIARLRKVGVQALGGLGVVCRWSVWVPAST